MVHEYAPNFGRQHRLKRTGSAVVALLLCAGAAKAAPPAAPFSFPACTKGEPRCYHGARLPERDDAACAVHGCGADCIPDVTGRAWSLAKGNKCVAVDWDHQERSKTSFHQLSSGDCAASQPERRAPAAWAEVVYGKAIGNGIASAKAAFALIAEEPASREKTANGAKKNGIVRLTFRGRFGDRITQYVVARLVADHLGFALGIDETPVHMNFAFATAGNHGAPPAPETMGGMSKQLLRGPVYGLHRVLANPKPRLIHIDGLGGSEMWFVQKHATKIRHEILVPSLNAADRKPAVPQASDVVVHLDDSWPDCRSTKHALPFAYYEAALDAMYTDEPWGKVWLVTRCGADDKTAVELMRKYDAKMFAAPPEYASKAYKLQVHELLFLVAAQRLVLAGTTHSWWGGFLSAARQIHTPLVPSTWGTSAANMMYANETRYTYHDLVSVPMRHDLSFTDIEHEEWVQNAHDRFCARAYCKAHQIAGVDPVSSHSSTNTASSSSPAGAGGEESAGRGQGAAGRSRVDTLAAEIEDAVQIFRDKPVKKCAPVQWSQPATPYVRRQSDTSAGFEDSVAHVSNPDARKFMQTIGIAAPPAAGKHRLAVVVPYRDREVDLAQFVPHMHTFLEAQGVDFTLIVVNQTDANRFNRGELINIGHQLSKWTHDYMVMHDVDLYPANPSIPYAMFPNPGEVYSLLGSLHPTERSYRYVGFLGGVCTVRMDDFERMNGFPNNFWGWGGEDDAFHRRLKRQGIRVKKIENLVCIDTQFKTWTHDSCEERDVSNKNFRPSKKSEQNHGISTGSYTIPHIELQEIVKDGQTYPFVRLDVQIDCSAEDVNKDACTAPIMCSSGTYAARSHVGQVHEFALGQDQDCKRKKFKVKWNCESCLTECGDTAAHLVGECGPTSGPVCVLPPAVPSF